jgi:hypothetical protein
MWLIDHLVCEIDPAHVGVLDFDRDLQAGCPRWSTPYGPDVPVVGVYMVGCLSRVTMPRLTRETRAGCRGSGSDGYVPNHY